MDPVGPHVTVPSVAARSRSPSSPVPEPEEDRENEAEYPSFVTETPVGDRAIHTRVGWACAMAFVMPSRITCPAREERIPAGGSPVLVMITSMRATSSRLRADSSSSRGDRRRFSATIARTSERADWDMSIRSSTCAAASSARPASRKRAASCAFMWIAVNEWPRMSWRSPDRRRRSRSLATRRACWWTRRSSLSLSMAWRAMVVTMTGKST